MVRNVLEQPIDCVRCIRALVEIGRGLFVHDVRRDLLKSPLGKKPTADVLVDKDVTGLHEVFTRTKRRWVSVCTIRSTRIGRTLHQDWIAACRVLWAKDCRV